MMADIVGLKDSISDDYSCGFRVRWWWQWWTEVAMD